MDQFLQLHYCRLRVRPYDWWYSLEDQRPVDHGRMNGWDVSSRLPEIRMPSLITVGKYDAITPRCSRALHRGIRGSKLVVFQKSSHVAFWEQRDRYVDVLHRFLDKVK